MGQKPGPASLGWGGPRRSLSSLQMVNSTQETSPAGGSGDPKLADPSVIWPFDIGTCCQKSGVLWEFLDSR